MGFRGLKESLDTTTAGGRLIFQVFGALAEFEREIIRERTMAGLEAARVRGRHGGRPSALDESKTKLARTLKEEGEHSVEEICSMLGVGRSTLYRYLGGALTMEASDNDAVAGLAQTLDVGAPLLANPMCKFSR